MKTFYKTILTLLFYFLSCLLNIAYGQGENNIWYFGYHSGLDFNSGSPVFLTNGQIYTREGVATISDAAGSLLFYSDGISVWNHNHVVMPNGNNLLGSGTSTQSATIVPQPGSGTLYYLFTCPAAGTPNNFRYSIVDMTLDGGNGDITLKNIPLHAGSSEKCVAVYKNNSPEIWVIGHGSDTLFYAYLVTSSGINTPVISLNSPMPGTYGYDVGYMKASPLGDKIAAANYTGTGADSFVLFDFNCNNGDVSNEMIFPTAGALYGLEFSPDGSKLYVIPWVSPPVPINQYDITLGSAAAIAASQATVGSSPQAGLGGMQIGPDQKIYISIENGGSLSVINDPNIQGTACNFVDYAISLGSTPSGIGLPALIRGNSCTTTSISDLQIPNSNLQIFPNPSSGIFQITFPSSFNQKTNYSLEVINTLGQTVFEQTLSTAAATATVALNVSFLPKGIYVLRLCIPSGKINDGTSTVSNKLIIK